MKLVRYDQQPFCFDLILNQVICQSKVGDRVPRFKINDIAVTRYSGLIQTVYYCGKISFRGYHYYSLWVSSS